MVSKISTLNPQTLQENVMSWHKTLNNIKNFSNIVNYTKPAKMLEFLVEEVEVIKNLLPIVSRLRAKGLELRHFKEMS